MNGMIMKGLSSRTLAPRNSVEGEYQVSALSIGYSTYPGHGDDGVCTKSDLHSQLMVLEYALNKYYLDFMTHCLAGKE